MGGFHPLARHLGVEMFFTLFGVIKITPRHADKFRQVAINHQDRFGLMARQANSLV